MKIQTWLLSVAAAGFVFGAASTGFAQLDCTNDVDCPDTACGDQVCQWVDADTHTCMAPGSEPRGMDGWCTTNADCKCAGMGATCTGIYCSFTRPQDAPASGGTTGAGGSTSAGGSSTAGTGSDEPAEDEGGCSMSSAPSNGLAAFGVAIGVGALAFGLRRRRF